MKVMNKNILITGGAGFIGSHVTNYFTSKYPNYRFVVIDSLTYAANLHTIMNADDNTMGWKSNMIFWKADIRDIKSIDEIFSKCNITDVIHLAAESHVDNSITNPNIFAETNVIGTLNLLNAAIKHWKGNKENRFYHVSTDEVYGDLKPHEAPFTELTPYNPSSPYSASKAASDHFVRAYGRTYGLNYVISNCSNNYGPHQHTEKFIPVIIKNLVKSEKIPLYGTGQNIRDWLWVGDHVNAIDEILHNGEAGQTYNVGGDNEMSNLGLINVISEMFLDKYVGESPNPSDKELPFRFVEDRKGHDLRYAVNSDKLQTNLNWKPKKDMKEGLEETMEYYVNLFTT